MELWIRSQDKLKLVNNCNLYINNRYNNEFVIKVLNEENIILVIYETKERALEVLDKIQDLLQNAYIPNSNRIVYQMPEE